MFASHVVSGRPSAEFRVFLIGDSATWGWLLRNEETLAGQLNALACARPMAAPCALTTWATRLCR